MPTVGEYIIESLQKSGPTVGPEKKVIPFGIAGTESENVASLIAHFSKTAEETEPKKFGLPPMTAGGWPTIGTTIIAGLIKMFRGRGEKSKAEDFQEMVPRIVDDMRTRGYTDDVVQSLIDPLAKHYGQKTIDVSKM